LGISIHYLLKSDEAIKGIKEGDESALSKLYTAQRPFFIAWFKKNTRADENLIAEWYQEAFFILYENVRKEKLTEFDGSISAYLIGVGRNLERDHRKSGWNRKVDTVGGADYFSEEAAEDYANEETGQRMSKAMENMGEKCQQILVMFYYHRFPMDIIAERLGLKNADVAKKSKYECLKKLRKIYHRDEN